MPFIAAFRGKVKDIGRVGHLTANPIRNLLAKAAFDVRVVPALVRFRKVFEPSMTPLAHRHHDRILIHCEMAVFVELQAPLPRVPEPIWPLSRMTIALVPDVFLSPEPSLLSQGQY